MILKKGFKSRTICGEFVLTPQTDRQVDFNRLISMNDTAKYLWNSLQDREFQIDDMVKLLLEEYDVSSEQAKADSEQLVKDWQNAGLME